VRLFRLTCLGAFFHVLLLINILMQMYFDLRKQALATSLVFLSLNGLLAWWSVNRGVETYGIGYALASFMALLLGYLLLYRALDQLDYMTFTSQPIGSDEERREATVLAEEERAAEEAAAAAEAEGEEEEEEEEREAPAPIVVAAGEMAPPEPLDEVSVDEVVLEEQEAVPDLDGAAPATGWETPGETAPETATDLPAMRPAGPPREVAPAPDVPIETATDLPGEPKVVPPAPAPEAPVETATDLPGEPKVVPPAPTPVASDLSRRSPEGAEADATATDLPGESELAPPTASVPDAATTEPALDKPAETATDLPDESKLVPDATATDVPREPTLTPPTASVPDAATTEPALDRPAETATDLPEESEPVSTTPPETATDVAGEPGITRPAGDDSDLSRHSAEGAKADATATDVDPAALDAVVDEIEDELEFVGFGPRTPKVADGATETDLGSYLDVVPSEEGAEEEATATDVGELSELEAAVADLAAQVEADPLHEEDEAVATATDVGSLSSLKKAVDALAADVDAGGLDEEAEADEEAEEEPEDEPETPSQLRVDPSDETEAD
jgi:hypothetical protein